jgi:hypothetical protein
MTTATRQRIASTALLVAVVASLILLVNLLGGCASWQGLTPDQQADAVEQIADGLGAAGTAAAPLAGPAAPWVLLGSYLIPLIAGAFGGHLRGARVTATKIVRSLDGAKVEGPSATGKVTIDTDKLGKLQDAAGVRGLVRKVR